MAGWGGADEFLVTATYGGINPKKSRYGRLRYVYNTVFYRFVRIKMSSSPAYILIPCHPAEKTWGSVSKKLPEFEGQT
jgi:hypothetical protein